MQAPHLDASPLPYKQRKAWENYGEKLGIAILNRQQGKTAPRTEQLDHAIQRLIKDQCDLNSHYPPGGENPFTPLHSMITLGEKNAVSKLLENGANPFVVSNRQTPLEKAEAQKSLFGDTATEKFKTKQLEQLNGIQTLLKEAIAKPRKARAKAEATAQEINLVRQKQALQDYELLKEKSANRETSEEADAEYADSLKEAVSRIIHSGFNVNNVSSIHLLHAMTTTGQIASVKLLLENGANPFLKKPGELSPYESGLETQKKFAEDRSDPHVRRYLSGVDEAVAQIKAHMDTHPEQKAEAEKLQLKAERKAKKLAAKTTDSTSETPPKSEIADTIPEITAESGKAEVQLDAEDVIAQLQKEIAEKHNSFSSRKDRENYYEADLEQPARIAFLTRVGDIRNSSEGENLKQAEIYRQAYIQEGTTPPKSQTPQPLSPIEEKSELPEMDQFLSPDDRLNFLNSLTDRGQKFNFLKQTVQTKVDYPEATRAQTYSHAFQTTMSKRSSAL